MCRVQGMQPAVPPPCLGQRLCAVGRRVDQASVGVAAPQLGRCRSRLREAEGGELGMLGRTGIDGISRHPLLPTCWSGRPRR